MAYFLTVTSGADSGKSFRIDSNECIIGRSPSATLVLRDESIAWEHAVVRESGGKLTLANLAAQGTRIKGKRVTDDVRLGPNDVIQLSDDCQVVLEQRIGSGAGGSSRLVQFATVFILLAVVLGGAGFMMARNADSGNPPMTMDHWRTAYRRIDTRLEEWHARGTLPAEVVAEFRDGWRLEQAASHTSAAAKWAQLRSLLMSLPAPIEDDRRMIAELAEPTPKALGVVMGWDRRSSSADFHWESDEAFADALVWFVRKRAEVTKNKSEATE